jgi:hypothetical protein
MVRVHAAERDAFALVRSHIQAVVPIGILELDHIMVSDVIELYQDLYEQMLQYRPFVNLAPRVALEKIRLPKSASTALARLS